LNLARRPEADALPAGQPSFNVALRAIGSPSAPSPLLAPLPEPRAQLGATSLPNYLGSECEIVLRTCIVAGGFTRPTGDLGLQLCRRTDHVETRSPPYVPHIVAVEETLAGPRLVTNDHKTKGNPMRVILAGVVAAFLMAAPLAHAAGGNLVQIDGKLVAPSQLSEAQLAAGHDPSTRLVQIGGSFVAPSQVSAWQNADGPPADRWSSAGASSSDFGAGKIALTAVGGSIVLLAGSALLMRRRLTPA
jgi:hypothetical protein